MATQEEAYTIPDDVLDSLRKELESRKQAARPSASRSDAAAARDSRPPAAVRSTAAGGAGALIASSLSLVISGSGQLYNGQAQLGLALLLMETFAVAAHWALARIWSPVVELAGALGIAESQIVLAVVVADFVMIVLLLCGVHQAFRQAEIDTGPFGGFNHPLLSGIASTVLPGWGQLVNAQIGKALAFLFVPMTAAYTFVLWMSPPFVRALVVLDPQGVLHQRVSVAALSLIGAAGAMWMLSIYDAVLVAGYRRRTP